MNRCVICGKSLSTKGLGTHLAYKHRMNCKDYYDKFFKKENEGKCKICGSPTSYRNINIGYSTYCSIKCSGQDVAIKEKRKTTTMQKYGYESTNQVPEIKEKMIKSNISKYGVANVMQNKEICTKAMKNLRESNMKNYSVEWGPQREDVKKKLSKSVKKSMSEIPQHKKKEMYKKQRESYRINNSYKTSKYEENFYAWLISMFNVSDVYRNYDLDNRYPYPVDFYVKPLDLFIELNIHWTHGGHWFDENNEEDIRRLTWLLEKTKNKKYPQYEANINIWTKKDPKKRQTAVDNKLNYVVLWGEEDIKKFKEEFIHEE